MSEPAWVSPSPRSSTRAAPGQGVDLDLGTATDSTSCGPVADESAVDDEHRPAPARAISEPNDWSAAPQPAAMPPRAALADDDV